MTAVTAGCRRHQAIAHWAIGTPGGTSSRCNRSTSARSRFNFSAYILARTSLAGNTGLDLYLPESNPLASGTRASTPR